jgi:hypothetical protein
MWQPGGWLVRFLRRSVAAHAGEAVTAPVERVGRNPCLLASPGSTGPRVKGRRPDDRPLRQGRWRAGNAVGGGCHRRLAVTAWN